MKPAPNAQTRITTNDPPVTMSEFFKYVANAPSDHTWLKFSQCGSLASEKGLEAKLFVSRRAELNKKNTGSKTIKLLKIKTDLKNNLDESTAITAPPHAFVGSAVQ